MDYPSSSSYMSQQDTEEDSGDILSWRDNKGGSPTFGSQLTTEQQNDLQTLLTEYSGVLSDIPGQTTLVEHHIDTQEERPIRLPSYRLPQAYRSMVQNEMIAHGIIETSKSE